MTSEELYNRCKEKEEEAWAYAYNYVLVFLKKRCGPVADIEDLAQNTLKYFLEKDLVIREKQAFKQLLRSKAYGFFVDRYRCQIRGPKVPLEFESENGHSMIENPGIEPVLPKTDEALFFEKTVSMLRRSLTAIGEECETILERYFRGRFLGDNTVDMSEELGLQASTFRVKVHRCLKKLFRQPEYAALLADYKAG